MSDQSLNDGTSAIVQPTQAQMMAFSNLMALGGFDTSDLTAQVSRLTREGIYVSELSKLGFVEQTDSDPANPSSYILNIQSLILDYKPLENGEMPSESLVGKNLNERYFVWGKDVQNGLQLLMGKFKIGGFKHKGKMGGVEGAEPGWIDEALGKRVVTRVHHYKPKDGEERAQFNWLSPIQLEKLKIDWRQVLGRDYLDEFGRVIANPLERKKAS